MTTIKSSKYNFYKNYISIVQKTYKPGQTQKENLLRVLYRASKDLSNEEYINLFIETNPFPMASEFREIIETMEKNNNEKDKLYKKLTLAYSDVEKAYEALTNIVNSRYDQLLEIEAEEMEKEVAVKILHNLQDKTVLQEAKEALEAAVNNYSETKKSVKIDIKILNKLSDILMVQAIIVIVNFITDNRRDLPQNKPERPHL